TVRGNRTVVCQNMDSRSGSTPQRLSKRRMGIRVRRKIPHILHLDHEKHIGFISLLFCKYQFFQMLDRTLAGRIRKTADAVFLQRHSLYLNEYPLSLRFHIEVKAGISIGCLRSHKRHIPEEMPSPDPFLDQTVRNLGVHIDRSEERRVGRECRSRWVREPLRY